MKSIRTQVLLCLLLTSGLGATLTAQGIESVELTPAKDNTLYQSDTGSLSNGAGIAVFAGRTAPQNGGARRRAVLAFDVSSIPQGATVAGVTLKLRNSSTRNNGTQTVELHRLTSDWGEGTSNAGSTNDGDGAPATTGDATWIHTFFDTQQWDSGGGDFAADLSASVQVGANGLYFWGSDAMLDDVQGWVDDPSSNFGWILIGNEGTTATAKRFNSREAASDPPVLLIDYIPAQRDLTFQMYFPQFGNGDGFVSQIILVNPSTEETAHARILARSDSGDVVIVNQDIVIRPEGTGGLESSRPGVLQTGSVTVLSDIPLSGVIVFGGSFGLAGVPASDSFSNGFLGPVDVRLGQNIRTGVSIQNLQEEPVEVQLDLLDNLGTVAATTSVEIPALGKLARFVDELEWDSAVDFQVFQGTIRSTPNGDISALMIQNRLVGGVSQFATLPVTKRP